MSQISQLAAELAPLRAELLARQDSVIREAIAIQQIAAPTFDEKRRAEYVYQRFQGLENLELDRLHNVFGCLPGQDRRRPAVLLSAHTDTVFEAATPLDIKREQGMIIGPGIGDNSLGVAGLLAVLDLLKSRPLPSDVWFAANSCEEGLGNLAGMRAVYQRLAPKLGQALVIEGMAFGRIYHAGIAVRRLEISCHTPGGHSWLHFGRPSAIHGLVRLGAQITNLQPPTTPRTTYNIGVIQGGRSVNSIAAEASLLLDLRSENRDALAALEKSVMMMIDAMQAPDMTFKVKVVGDRPVGSIPVSHPLVQLAREVLESIGVQPIFEVGSTDANVPLSEGLPAVVVGITQGSNAHRVDEYIETASIADGLWQLLLLTVGVANGLADC